MSKYLISVVVLILACVGGLAYVQLHSARLVRAEIASLRRELRETRPAPTAHPPLSPSPSPTVPENSQAAYLEIAALRNEIRQLQSSLQSAGRPVTGSTASPAASIQLIPVGEMKNAGHATPESAAETLMWAAVAGDLDAVARTLTLTPAARQKADDWFSRQSDETRRQYGTPERLMALLLARDAGRLSGMRVLGQDTLGADDTIVRLRYASEEGKTKDDTLPFHRTGSGWQLQLTERAVDRFARQLGGGG